MVVLIALALTLFFGLIGWGLKSLLWNGVAVPKNATDYGRKLSSYFLFISILTSSHHFVQKDLSEAIVASIVTVLVFSALGFLLGLVYGLFVPHKNLSEAGALGWSKSSQSLSIINGSNSKPTPAQGGFDQLVKPEMNSKNFINEEVLWAEVFAELEGGNRKFGVWAKAFAESGGDENKAKALYLKIRFDEVIKEKSLIIRSQSHDVLVSERKKSSAEQAEEGGEQIQRRLVNIVRKSVRYEDALSLLDFLGFEVRVKSTGFLSPEEYEIWDKSKEILIFKAISKGLVIRFVKDKFCGE